MRPVTDVVAKELLPVGGNPAIHHVVDEAIEADIEEILVVLAPDKGEVHKYLGDGTRFPGAVDIHFATQSEPWGPGDASVQIPVGERS